MNKELRAFRKICRNLNSYEFTDEYKKNKKLIETTLKNYEELTSKPAILYGRTHGHTQALIDTICKNYKEVKITNLEDEKKLKALEIIKEKNVWFWVFRRTHNVNEYNEKVALYYPECDELTQEEYDILKEVFYERRRLQVCL